MHILNELAGNSFMVFCGTCNTTLRLSFLLNALGLPVGHHLPPTWHGEPPFGRRERGGGGGDCIHQGCGAVIFLVGSGSGSGEDSDTGSGSGSEQGCARLMNQRQHDSSYQPLAMYSSPRLPSGTNYTTSIIVPRRCNRTEAGRTEAGRRCFAYRAPALYNSLPAGITDMTRRCFDRAVRTHPDES